MAYRPRLILALLSLLAVLPGMAAATSRWPTATRPQDAIYVPLAGPPGSRAFEDALLKAERAAARGWPAESGVISLLRRQGRLAAGQRLLPERTVVMYDANSLLLAPARRSAASYPGRRARAGTLTFRYTGWTTAQQTALSGFVTQAYPVLVSVYGAPYASIEVNIVRDDNLQNMLGGTYNASTNEIRMPGAEPTIGVNTTYTLTNLILRAFHDDAMLFYDAWETGFCRAAALAAFTRIETSFSASQDPFYFLPLYELVNKPALGNSRFFPQSGFTGMSVWRIGMAQAAWLKVMAHYPNFFRDFNAAYYAQAGQPRTPPLAGDVAALVQIAAGVAPTVESLPFADWFKRQRVLDSSVSIGRKLFIAALPLYESVFLELNYYSTQSTGDERTLSGTAFLSYWGWDGVPYYPFEGNEITVTAGQGALIPTFTSVGGPQRIYIEATLDQRHADAYFPYQVRGALDENELFGISLGADSGTLDVTLPDWSVRTVSVAQGAWSLDLGAALASNASHVLDLQVSGLPGQRRRAGTGWLNYAAVTEAAPPAAGSVSHTFPAGMTMVTFPVKPFQAGAAAALGVDPLKLLLAGWQPYMPGTSKYVFFPNTGPLAPGQGYWLKLDQPLSVTISGMLPSTAAPYPVRLLTGWNQVGNPFTAAVPTSSVSVQYLDGAPMTFADAVEQGLVSSCYRVGSTGSYETTATLWPWEGVWVQAVPAEGLWLLVSPP